MTIPAPQAPATPADAAPGQPAPQPGSRPEVVELLLLVWRVTLGAELVHQLLNVLLTLSNRDAILAQARKVAAETMEGSAGPLPDSVLQLGIVLAVGISALLALGILAFLAWMLRRLGRPGKRAGTARRIWFFFSLYFALRALFVFILVPDGGDVPDWLFVTDGAIKIIVGVAAGLGAYFANQERTLQYTGEYEQMRQLEREMEQQRREKDREKAQEKREENRKSDRGRWWR